MKLVVLFFITLISMEAFSQEQVVNQLRFVKTDGSQNSDETLFYRDDKVGDRTRLVLKMGDEYTSDFEIGYKYYVDGNWYKTFSLDGYGNGYFKGNVAIGVAGTNARKLVVNGTITATEIKVEAQTADFVFEDDYQLKSLEEVELFVQTNKHLPDIPSAKEMKEDGVGLAEMNKLLLQKVEELTLYAIEKNKEIKQLNKDLTEKMDAIDSLNKRLSKLEIMILK